MERILAKFLTEGFAAPWAIFVFSDTPMDAKRYFICVSVVNGLSVIVNLFGIDVGMKVIIVIMVFTVLGFLVIKIPIIQSVKMSFLVVIAILVSEMVNTVILSTFFPQMTHLQWYHTIPSSIVFSLIVAIVKIAKNSRMWRRIRSKHGKSS